MSSLGSASRKLQAGHGGLARLRRGGAGGGPPFTDLRPGSGRAAGAMGRGSRFGEQENPSWALVWRQVLVFGSAGWLQLVLGFVQVLVFSSCQGAMLVHAFDPQPAFDMCMESALFRLA